MADVTDRGYINNLVGLLLRNTEMNWQNEMLYSWSWGLGLEHLDPKSPILLSMRSFHTKKLNFSKFPEHRENGISGELSERIVDRFPCRLKHYFILELHANDVLAGGYGNACVTNVLPDISIFGKNALHSEIGYWKF